MYNAHICTAHTYTYTQMHKQMHTYTIHMQTIHIHTYTHTTHIHTMHRHTTHIHTIHIPTYTNIPHTHTKHIYTHTTHIQCTHTLHTYTTHIYTHAIHIHAYTNILHIYTHTTHIHIMHPHTLHTYTQYTHIHHAFRAPVIQPQAGNSRPFISVFFCLASPFWGMYRGHRGLKGKDQRVRRSGPEQLGEWEPVVRCSGL